MKWAYYNKLLKPSTGKTDVSVFFKDKEVFHNLIIDLALKNVEFDKVACLDATGFVLGSAVAFHLGKGLIPIRREGKLPLQASEVYSISFVDYSKKEKSFELSKAGVDAGDKILIVDDWIETGAQVKAAIDLLEQAGGKVVGISTIGFDKNEQTEELLAYNLSSLR